MYARMHMLAYAHAKRTDKDDKDENTKTQMRRGPRQSLILWGGLSCHKASARHGLQPTLSQDGAHKVGLRISPCRPVQRERLPIVRGLPGVGQHTQASSLQGFVPSRSVLSDDSATEAPAVGVGRPPMKTAHGFAPPSVPPRQNGGEQAVWECFDLADHVACVPPPTGHQGSIPSRDPNVFLDVLHPPCRACPVLLPGLGLSLPQMKSATRHAKLHGTS